MFSASNFDNNCFLSRIASSSNVSLPSVLIKDKFGFLFNKSEEFRLEGGDPEISRSAEVNLRKNYFVFLYTQPRSSVKEELLILYSVALLLLDGDEMSDVFCASTY